MTPSPTPVLSIDPIAAAQGLFKSLQGGTVTQVIAGVLILLAILAYFLFQGQIKKRQQADAARETENQNREAHQGAAGGSSSQESQLAEAQRRLSAAEKVQVRTMLDGLADPELINFASNVHGGPAVVKAIVDNGMPGIFPLTQAQRAAIYKLYGVE